MCGIYGVVPMNGGKHVFDIAPIAAANAARGRDAWGVATALGHTMIAEHYFPNVLIDGAIKRAGCYDANETGALLVAKTTIGNCRAEPTTEFVKGIQPADIQPYRVGSWTIVHNGTIANDKALCAKHGLNPPTRIDSWVIAALCDKLGFDGMLREIVGSYAIIAMTDNEPGVLYYAVNYRPLYYGRVTSDDGGEWGVLSSEIVEHGDGRAFTLVRPYSFGRIHWRFGGIEELGTLYPPRRSARALVVLSGGLDSTVAAVMAQDMGFDVELLHFDYGCRATVPERRAVEAIAENLDLPLHVITTPLFTDTIGGSRLTNTKEAIADGEAGAEYAHEWVPARNLIMLSIATGYAEAHKFDYIVLGANLEEAGAYPDNEPEFINQFNRLLPFAVADGKELRVLTPVGNMMKKEIVAKGIERKAPLHLTFSCYNAQPDESSPIGFRHCGHCGPCFMRKTAFELNGAVDPVFANYGG